MTEAEKFWARVRKGAADECWPWIGAYGNAKNTYGRYIIDGKARPAHQVAWEMANGKKFPVDMIACHECDNPNCVNPQHITPGTQSDNIQGCADRGRHGSMPRDYCPKGHEMSAENRKPTTGGFRCGKCARDGTRMRMRKWREKRRDELKRLMTEGK